MKYETKLARNEVIKETKEKFSNDQIARYKQMAVTRKSRMRYTQEYLGELFELANKYVKEQAEKGKPLTIAGFQRAFNIDYRTWYDIRGGSKDHALYEFLAEQGLPEDYADTVEQMVYEVDGKMIPLITYSEFIDGLYLRQQELLEEACMMKQNPVGAIFLMKAMHGFNDNTGVTVTNNTLNVNVKDEEIAKLDEIERARRLLG